MNQILYTKENNLNQNSNTTNGILKKFTKYRILLVVSLIVAVSFLGILGFKMMQDTTAEKKSKNLLNSFKISTLYNTNEEKTTVEKTNMTSAAVEPFVVGILRIDKIRLNYPILSQSDKELLKIALCRFAGPMPNEIGNLCIAGHNYVDYRFFSRLNELKIGDKILVYDLSGKEISYIIERIYEAEPNDLSCTNQDVGDNRIVTLITCNNVNGTRTIVKAKEMKSPPI